MRVDAPPAFPEFEAVMRFRVAREHRPRYFQCGAIAVGLEFAARENPAIRSEEIEAIFHPPGSKSASPIPSHVWSAALVSRAGEDHTNAQRVSIDGHWCAVPPTERPDEKTRRPSPGPDYAPDPPLYMSKYPRLERSRAARRPTSSHPSLSGCAVYSSSIRMVVGQFELASGV